MATVCSRIRLQHLFLVLLLSLVYVIINIYYINDSSRSYLSCHQTQQNRGSCCPEIALAHTQVYQNKYSRSFIVFKLPRSGSSWFTDLLNGVPCLFASKEIIQSGDVSQFSIEEMEKHLSRALQTPTDKLSHSRARFLPSVSGRFMEDYYLHRSLKPFRRRLAAVGFTVNPEHCEGIAWKKVWRGNSPPRVIIYSRRNVVKSVISDYRGRQMKALCGESNLSRGAQALQCQHKMPSRLNVSVSDFMRSVYHWQRRVNQFEVAVSGNMSAVRLFGLSTLRVFYEDLQSNSQQVIQMVEAFLTAPVVTAKEDVSGPTSLPLRCSTTDCHPNLSVGNIPQQQKSRWVKRTPDDLTQLLVGFDELLAALGPANLTHVNNTIIIDPCACWRKQLLEERQIPGGLGQEHLCLQSDAELCFGKYL